MWSSYYSEKMWQIIYLQLKGVCRHWSYKIEIAIVVKLVMEKDVAEYLFAVERSLSQLLI